ncbi:Pycsar system effector family protein [Pedobacter nyackensis]|uniref:HD domain-containing protein n=1 Tax=Pedobacter nyackensis TaxID=475255 RepID=A0A1W2ETR4_9SPHI|nr:Pycsar system effector family protein [Pedobacter nyackensis]SMD12568.1 HD domain-containing protein [Pedobacter nyackensis]
MQYKELLDQLRAHIVNLFQTKNDERFIYHNLQHTEQVVQNVIRIADHYQLSERDHFVVVAASWFHDLGYLFDCRQHEAKGAELAAEFLKDKALPEDIILDVKGCIMATKMPQQPEGLLQQIVCDADLFHLGSDSFKVRNKLMRMEVEAFCDKQIDKAEWRTKTIGLFKTHHYHTDFCQNLLNSKKAENLAEMEGKEGKGKSKPQPEKKVELIEEKSKMTEKPKRGIETMFRISSTNHQRLSDMADNKAHIMISTNSIILSVILSLLLRKLEDNPHLIIPTLLLLIICVITMVFSILATRPSIPEGLFTTEDIKEKKVNLLFFGNFYRMSLEDYKNGMNKMMDDRDFLYGSLIKDVYSQGVVLGRKYRLLRIAYSVFMFGIIAAVLAFIIASAVVTL